MSRHKKNNEIRKVKLKNSKFKANTASNDKKRNKKPNGTDNEKNKSDDGTKAQRAKLMVRRYEEFHENFLDYDKILKFLEKTQKCNSSTVDLIKIGNSTQGKPIYMILITSSFSNTAGPKMATFVEAGLNGENAMAVSNTLYMIEYLTKNPNSVRIMDYFIVPCCNPDAYDAFIKNKQKESNKKSGNYCDLGNNTSRSNGSKDGTGKSRSGSPRNDKRGSNSHSCTSPRAEKMDGLTDGSKKEEDAVNDGCDAESKNNDMKQSRSGSPINKTGQRRTSNNDGKDNCNSRISTSDGCTDGCANDDIKRSRSRSPIIKTEESSRTSITSEKNNTTPSNSRKSSSSEDCTNDDTRRSRSRSPIIKTKHRRASNSSENNTTSSNEENSTNDYCLGSSSKDDNLKKCRSRSRIDTTEQVRASCNSNCGKSNSKKENRDSSQVNKLCSKHRSSPGGRKQDAGVDLTVNFPVVLGLNDMQRISTDLFLEKIKHWKEHYVHQCPETTALINAIYSYQFAIKLLISLQEGSEAVCYPYGFCSASGEETNDLKEIAKKGKSAITARNFEYGSLYDIQGLSYGNLMDFLKVDKASIKYMYVIKVHKKSPRYSEKDELRQLMRYGCEIMECIKRMSCCVYKAYTNMTGNKQVETQSKVKIDKRSRF